MDQTANNCTACGSTDVRLLEKRQEFICEDCLHRWVSSSPGRAVDRPPDLDPEYLPTYLAAPLASLLAEPHPRVRLHWLVDCAEIAVRWSVVIALAEVQYSGNGALPESIVKRIRDQVERPTLGRWLSMLATLSTEPPEEALLAAGVFTLYRDHLAAAFRAESEGGTPETSLLVLRNYLAHGGGMRTEIASKLLTAHEAGVFDLLRIVRQASGGAEVVAIRNGMARRLSGPKPVAIACPPSLREASDGPWLVGEPGVLSLQPLAEYGPIQRIGSAGRLEKQSGDPAAQLYQRGDSRRLTYVPISGHATVSYVIDVEAFRALFRLDAHTKSPRSAGDVFHWKDFVAEARVLQHDLIGRRDALAVAKRWLNNRDGRKEGVARLGWLFGGPGLGKSLLMAKIAADLSGSKPRQQCIYYHRFRAGDARNNLRAFLIGLLAALADWAPLSAQKESAKDNAPDTDKKLIETASRQLARIAGLEPPNSKDPRPRFVVLLDGLDEVIPYEPNLPTHVCDLCLPGTVWLLAGRPEPALQQAFSASHCEAVFSDGLPPMSADDIRAMLLEGLASARHDLVARDEDTTDGVHNPFVDGVVECADGLPLYVHLLLEDLRDGRLSVNDEKQLPQGLVAYYDDLMNRVGLSDLKRDLPLLVAVLARAEEPLDIDALAGILAELPEDAPRYRERVQNAVRGGQAVLRTAPTADGTAGLTLYHQSFRDYVGGRVASDGTSATAAISSLVGTVGDAEAKLCRLARDWASLRKGNLRNHLFRWGVRYTLRWQRAAGVAAACRRLTDFAFLQAFTKEIPSSAVRSLVADYEALLAEISDQSEHAELGHWEAFFREREHVLGRGEERWPAYKILLQLAVEHAEKSPVTLAAERWLEKGYCDWDWLRNPRRSEIAALNPCIRVLEEEEDIFEVNGALALSDERLLSWAGLSLRLWNSQTGNSITALYGHTKMIRGAQALPDGRILSWSDDCMLRLWDSKTGEPLETLSGHTDEVLGALALPRERLVSWSKDCTLRLWDGKTGDLLATLARDIGVVGGALILPDRRFLTWSYDHTLRLWDSRTGEPLATLTGHTKYVSGALVLPDNRLLSWSGDGTLRLWDDRTGKSIATLAGHNDRIGGALALSDERLLSWSEKTLRLWDGKTNAPLATLTGHTGIVVGALALPDGRLLSWSWGSALRVWDGKTGAPLFTLTGHTAGVAGALALPDGRLLSWSQDRTLRLWDSKTGNSLATFTGHSKGIGGVLALPDGRLISWSGVYPNFRSGRPDCTLRVWACRPDTPLTVPTGHTGTVVGGQAISADRFLSWSDDRTLRLWDSDTGELLTTFAGHTGGVRGALALPDRRLLSWSEDHTLRIWDRETGERLTTLMGHTAEVNGALIVSDECLLSWSNDCTLRLWDSKTGASLANLTGHKKHISGALALRDGRFLSWSYDRTLRLWDSRTGEPLATLTGHTEYVNGALVLPDNRLLSWSGDGTLRLWDDKTGKALATLTGHGGGVRIARALPNGLILSGSIFGDVRLWNGKTGELLAVNSGASVFEDAVIILNKYVLSWSFMQWSRSQQEFILWEMRSAGKARRLLADDLLASAPGLLWERARILFPNLVVGNTFGWDFLEGTAGIARGRRKLRVCWFGEGSGAVHALTAEGVLIASFNHEILALQLHQGNRRISIAEYESAPYDNADV